MEKGKKHGQSPCQIAVIHGGPGAAGDVTDLAQELGKNYGVLEPYQTANTIAGQVTELKEIIEKNRQIPVTLIGHSWGAFLSFIFTAYHPQLVKKLILVSSGVFSQKYVNRIGEIRLGRISPEQGQKIKELTRELNNFNNPDSNLAFSQFGELIAEVDAYDPLPIKNKCQSDFAIYQNVWPKFQKLRKSGKLTELGRKITCPVVVVHGNYDPRPAEGIKNPLFSVIKDFKFILLKNCGHYPWREKEAKDNFFQIIRKEVQ